MNKRKVFAFSLAFALFLPATTLFAGAVEEICFQNSFAQLFRFSGGKIGKKPYVVEFFAGGCGFVPGLATTMKDSSGNIILAIHLADSDDCSAVVWYFVGDPLLLSALGTYDNYPRGLPPHSADSLSRINCLGFPAIRYNHKRCCTTFRCSWNGEEVMRKKVMKKFILLILFGCAILIIPRSGFAKTFCFVGVSGGNIYFELNSGKVDVKPFGGYVFVEGLTCRVGQWGAIITDDAGIQRITTNSSHDPVEGCLSVQTYGSGDVATGFDINYDNGQDGTIDGSFFIAPINCNAVPLESKKKSAAKPTDYSFGGLSKKAE